VVLEKAKCREFLFFRLQDAKQTLENLGATGATMGNVNKGKFESVEVATPPEDLIACYHQFAAPFFSKILVLSRQTTNLRCTRDLLLPRLLSGTINAFDTDSLDSYSSDERSSSEPTATIKVGSNRSTGSPGDFPDSDKGAPAAAVSIKLSSHGSAQKPSGNQLELSYELPPPIDQTDRSDVLTIIRQVFGDSQPRTRDNAIREVARTLGYGRVGHRIQDVLHTDLLTAVRRGILLSGSASRRKTSRVGCLLKC
jgi:hypothetical protein